MKVKDIMTPSPCCCSPTDAVQDVARMMRDHDCGAIPVVENAQVIGIVTDRDLALRVLANGGRADAKIGEIISRNPQCCSPDDDLGVVERVMFDNQVRRVPIVDVAGACVGIVAQADLARAAQDGERVSEVEVAILVERISEPARRPFDGGARDPLEQIL